MPPFWFYHKIKNNRESKNWENFFFHRNGGTTAKKKNLFREKKFNFFSKNLKFSKFFSKNLKFFKTNFFHVLLTLPVFQQRPPGFFALPVSPGTPPCFCFIPVWHVPLISNFTPP
jgi:hypothetical protein